jgi:hypothetical protein
MAKRKRARLRRVIKLPVEYFEAVELGNILFPSLYQLENGLRLAVNKFLTTCYGAEWWEVSLKSKLPDVYNYAEQQELRRNSMPWVGSSAKVPLFRIHLITLGQLELIVKAYKSECIPHLFPSLEFFIGHMEVIKRVRNLYSHMFPCITQSDCRVAKNEIATLSMHINARL